MLFRSGAKLSIKFTKPIFVPKASTVKSQMSLITTSNVKQEENANKTLHNKCTENGGGSKLDQIFRRKAYLDGISFT